LSHRTVRTFNEAGDRFHRYLRAALNSPTLGRGRFVRLIPPYAPPHKYSGQYGPGFINMMTHS